MTSSIIVNGNIATIEVNPTAVLSTYLDKWRTHGYIASLGLVGGKRYAVKQVKYNLGMVSLSKVQEVAGKFDAGAFNCPVCQKLSDEILSEEPSDEPAPITEVSNGAAQRSAVLELIRELDNATLLRSLRRR